MKMRSPTDGEPFYCAVCHAGFFEFLACDSVECRLETKAQARARAAQHLRVNGMPASAMPMRLQRPSVKGWKLPANCVYVGNGTKWRNPFRVGGYFMMGDPQGARGALAMTWCEQIQHPDTAPDPRFTRIADATMTVEWYRRFLEKISLDVMELRGRDLACRCRLDEPCHADVLIELANA